MPKTLVAIHQPNFLPWLGYFDKLARCDVFIAMDNAQFPKTGGGTWSNRVRLIVNGRAAWATVPIVRAYHGVLPIAEMAISDATPWRKKMLATIRTSYLHAPYFDDVYPLIDDLLTRPTTSLSELNLAGIRALAARVDLDPGKIVLGSGLDATGKATDLLISMVKAVGGTAYLSGDGAAGYQEDEKFAAAGLGLEFQRFEHPTYPQRNTVDFVPGLSTVDALMNLGFDGVARLLRSGTTP